LNAGSTEIFWFERWSKTCWDRNKKQRLFLMISYWWQEYKLLQSGNVAVF